MFARTLRFLAVLLVLMPCAVVLGQAQPVLKFDVTCDDAKIGTISIDVWEPHTPTSSGGAAGLYGVKIQGGFDYAPDPDACPLDPRASFYWIQGYIGQPTLYSWESVDKWSYDRSRGTPDTKIADGSPFYVNLRGPGYGHSTLGFLDAPRDELNADSPIIEFLFQTALVCAIPGEGGNKGSIHMIDGFTWEFRWVWEAGTPTFYDLGVQHSKAHFGDLFNAFMNDPDPDTLKNAWNLYQDGCCCIPLPSAVWMGLALLGAVVCGAPLRRRLAA